MITGWRSAVGGALLLLLLAAPPARRGLESGMASHMLLQLPLLALAGASLAGALPAALHRALAPWNRGGITGLVLATLVSALWMVPRALDGAIASTAWEAAKFVSLPLLVGAPLAISWRAAGEITRGFVLGNALSMLGVAGWLYRAAPVRLCNYYLLDQQQFAGGLVIVLTLALSLAWIATLFVWPRLWLRAAAPAAMPARLRSST